MVLQTTGPINLLNIQSEFGGTSPISISEYYRGSGLVPNGSLGIPASGAISFANFYGARKLSTLDEIVGAIKSTNYINIRNYLFSKTGFASGIETTNALSMSYSTSASYRYSTTVDASYTWPLSYVAAFSPFLNTSYLTVVARNFANSASLVASINVNNTSYVPTTIFSGSTLLQHRLSYVHAEVGSEAFKGLNIAVRYIKGSSNNENLQELYIIPGRWNPVSNTNGAALISSNVLANDIAIALSAGAEDAYFPAKGNFSGVTFTEVIRRTSRWYDNTRMRYAVMNSAGTLVFNPGANSSNVIDPAHVVIFRYVES